MAAVAAAERQGLAVGRYEAAGWPKQATVAGVAVGFGAVPCPAVQSGPSVAVLGAASDTVGCTAAVWAVAVVQGYGLVVLTCSQTRSRTHVDLAANTCDSCETNQVVWKHRNWTAPVTRLVAEHLFYADTNSGAEQRMPLINLQYS